MRKEKGRLEDNAETLGAVTTHTFTVPANTRWEVYGLYIERDANATLDIELYNAANVLLGEWLSQAAGTSNITVGLVTTGGVNFHMNAKIPLEAGWYIKVTWGAAQTTPEVACLVEEFDV